jgi:Flp pilus assembly protein TadG
MTCALTPLALLTRRFRKDKSGAAAIEFAIVAIPFFALMFAIIEVALSFFLGQVMETATADAARLIMTGQATPASMTQGQFKQKVCDGLPALFNCMSEVKVDVQTYSTFAGADVSNIDPTQSNLVENWQPGSGGSIVVVRVAYAMPVFLDLLGSGNGNLAGGTKRLLMATSAFRNEPFLSGAAAASN